MTEKTTPDKSKPAYPGWLLYVSLLLSGILFLAEAVHIYALQRVPAKLAIALIFSAIALGVGRGRTVGFVATGIMWLTVIALFFI